MDGRIDEIREAIEGLLRAANRNVGGMVPGVIASWCHKALAALSTIDPESIKRECAYKAKQAILSAPYDNPTRAYAAALAEAAIFSAEPAQDDGKARFRCRDCNSEFDESVMEYYCDDEDGEGDYIGECPVCGSRNLAEVKRRVEEAKE